MKKNEPLLRGRFLLTTILIVIFLLTAVMPAFAAPESDAAGTYAYDAATGKLDIDYAGFLSQHDLVYKNVPTNPARESMPVANGRVGGMVWHDDGMKMQVTNVDASPHTAISQAQVALKTNPALPTDTFEQRLNLYDGDITIDYGGEVYANIFGVPGTEMMGITVKDTRETLRSTTFDVNVWPTSIDKATLGAEDVAAWHKCVPFYDEANGIAGITKGVSETEPFGFTFAATVDGAEAEIRMLDENNIRIFIEPTADEYTIWLSSPAVLNAEDGDSVAQAKRELVEAKGKGKQYQQAGADWWHDYWKKSFIMYEDGTEKTDYLENVYYLAQYFLGGAGYATKPLHFINGVYRYSKDADIHWSCGYWHFNQRAAYSAAMASNRTEMIKPHLQYYLDCMPAMQGYTADRFGFTDGAMKTTETMRWDGFPFKNADRAGTTYDNDYVGWIYSTGPEVSETMYHYYQYTQNREALEYYYPYLEATVEFIVQWARYDEEKGEYHLDNSNSLENWWKINNSTPDNAGVRSVIPKFLEAYEILGKNTNPQLVAKATDVLEKLEPITVVKGENRYAPYDIYDKTVANCNMQNPELEMIYPHSVTGLGYPDYEMAVKTYNARDMINTLNIWTVDGVQAARLGMGDEAERVMIAMQERNQKLVSGYTDDGNGVVESLGYHAATTNEMYLQSYDQRIRVFPAAPSREEFKGAFTLLAEGGFLVSSEWEKGVKYIGMESTVGGEALVEIPWKTENVLVNGESVAVTDGEIKIATEKDGKYLIENPEAPVSGLMKTQISGARNESAKKLVAKTLGITDGLGPEPAEPASVAYTFEEIEDGKFKDQTEAANDAEVVGNVTAGEEGVDGKAAVFSGGYLRIPHSPTVDLRDNFEMSLDIKFDILAHGCTIFDKSAPPGQSTSTGFYLDYYDGKIRVIFRKDVVSFDPGFVTGEWYNIKIRYSTAEGYMKAYVDGEEKASFEVIDEIPQVMGEARIGTSRLDNQGLAGMIDNFKIKAIDEEVPDNPPVAADDQYTTAPGKTLYVGMPGVLKNDIGKGLDTVLKGQAANGSVNLYPDGSFTYTPNEGFAGDDSFTYQAYDSQNRASEPATVTIWVGLIPAPAADLYTAYVGKSLDGNVADNDRVNDGSPLVQVEGYNVHLVDNTKNGTLNMDEKGNFTYQPQEGFTGRDTFTYKVAMGGVESEPVIVTLQMLPAMTGAIYDFGNSSGTEVIDLLQGDNNGELVGAHAYVDDPDMGRSLHLRGGYMRIPYAENVNLTDSFSLEATIKAPELQFYNSLVSNYKDDINGLLLDIGPDDKRGNIHCIRVIAGDEIPGYSLMSNTEIKAGQVYNIKLVVQSSAGKVQLYVNGELDTEKTITKPLGNAMQDLCIGARNTGGGNAYNVLISQLEILNLNNRLYHVNANEVADGEITLSHGVAQEGETVTVTAQPDPGHKLKAGSLAYTVEGQEQPVLIDQESMQFAMPAGHVTVTGVFELYDGEYTVRVAPDLQNGTVRIAPESAKQGDTVTLTAAPNAGYAYADGTISAAANSGPLTLAAGANKNEFTFVMPGEDVTVGAAFSAVPYGITVPAFENGAVAADKEQATVEDEVVLTVTPAEGYKLRPGSLQANGLAIGTTFQMMPEDVTISAAFDAEETTYTPYMVTIAQLTGGSITPDKAQAAGGEVVALQILTQEGYRLVEGSLKVNGKAIAGQNFMMPDGNVEITAEFESTLYNIVIAKTANGTIEANKPAAAQGDTVQLTVTPDEGYRLVEGSLKVDGAPIKGISFEMPGADVAVTAEFELIPPTKYAINIGDTPYGKVTTDKTMAAENETVKVAATPDEGYRLVEGSLKVNGVIIKGMQFVMPNRDVEITAVFEPIPSKKYAIKIAGAKNGRIAVDKEEAAAGETVKVTATPDKGYYLKESSLKANGKPIEGGSFVMPAKSVTVTASFKQVKVDSKPKPKPTSKPKSTSKPTPEVVKVESVTLNMRSKMLEPKETVQLKATVLPSDATNNDVTWKSSNPKVATVSDAGKVKAIRKGRAVISATVDGKKAKTTITVSDEKVAVKRLRLNKGKVTLNVKGSYTPAAAVSPRNASDKKITWTTSNKEVATVNSRGKVTARGEGKAVIMATTNEGGRMAKCIVTVKPEVEKVKVHRTKVTLPQGRTLQMRAVISPLEAKGATISWKSSNPKVASIGSTGRMKTLQEGKATITVTVGHKKATCKVTVR